MFRENSISFDKKRNFHKMQTTKSSPTIGVIEATLMMEQVELPHIIEVCDFTGSLLGFEL